MKKYSEDLTYNNKNYNKKSSFDITNIYKYYPSFKIVLLGDSSSGKTSILEKYINNKIINNYNTTICVNYVRKIIHIDKLMDNNMKINDKILLYNYYDSIKLHIWDTSGCIKYKNFVKKYLKDVDIYILVFDITDNKYLQIINEYLKDIKDMNDNPELFIVLNKIDLNDKKLNIEQIIKDYNIEKYNYIETSCYTGYNINELFNQISLILIKKDILNKNDISNNDISNNDFFNKKTKISFCGIGTRSYCY